MILILCIMRYLKIYFLKLNIMEMLLVLFSIIHRNIVTIFAVDMNPSNNFKGWSHKSYMKAT